MLVVELNLLGSDALQTARFQARLAAHIAPRKASDLGQSEVLAY